MCFFSSTEHMQTFLFYWIFSCTLSYLLLTVEWRFTRLQEFGLFVPWWLTQLIWIIGIVFVIITVAVYMGSTKGFCTRTDTVGMYAAKSSWTSRSYETRGCGNWGFEASRTFKSYFTQRCRRLVYILELFHVSAYHISTKCILGITTFL